jgi:magnesium transporter
MEEHMAKIVADIDLFIPEIKGLIEQKKWTELRESLAELPAPDIATLLLNLEKAACVLVFRLLPRFLSTEVFSYLESKDKDDLIRDLNDEEARQLLAGLTPDDRTEFIAELPGAATQRLLNMLSPEDLKEVRELLGYPKECVGRLMTPDYVAVRPDWSIETALKHVRDKGRDSETVNVIYVVNSSWKLLDALALRRFILAKPGDTVEQIMDFSFVSISAFEDREKAVWMIQHYDLDALPVVDSEGILLGIVTVDDIMDVAQEEATEDFHKVAAVAPLKMSYSESSIWVLYRKRIGWLAALLAVSLISSGVIAFFGETLSSTMALAFFIPLLIGTGGNAGAQSATLMVRAIATGDINMGQWMRVLSKEMFVGSSLGFTMAGGGCALGLFRGGFEIGLIVGLAMICIVVVANILGAALPFLLTKLRLDPAVASSPLIASITDAAGLLIYFSIAARIIGRI